MKMLMKLTPSYNYFKIANYLLQNQIQYQGIITWNWLFKIKADISLLYLQKYQTQRLVMLRNIRLGQLFMARGPHWKQNGLCGPGTLRKCTFIGPSSKKKHFKKQLLINIKVLGRPYVARGPDVAQTWVRGCPNMKSRILHVYLRGRLFQSCWRCCCCWRFVEVDRDEIGYPGWWQSCSPASYPPSGSD
jgi:hypothetical protein